MNATELRGDLYAVLDSVLETGRPVTIERKGQRLILMPEPKKPHRAKKRWPKPNPKMVNGDIDDIVHIGWLTFSGCKP